jgi:hypothetical protein
MDLEATILEILKNVVLESKTKKGFGYHGSLKSEEIPYTVYWDPFYRNWASKDAALKGHILNELIPIISKVIKENE